tara:strand:+ start:820 stop:6813 length:5994 start_codon:yes stop_codon:yes gene_type:complete
MIDKVTPQSLNQDSDSRVRPSNQMIDALNLVFEDSFKNAPMTAGGANNDFSGDYAAIKPLPSNRDIEDILDLDDNYFVDDDTRIRVIGSVTDDVLSVIYFFVWSDDVEQMGVWAWDRDAVLPGNNLPGSYIRVYTSEKFNFPSDGFVKGDVVHIGQRYESTGEADMFAPATDQAGADINYSYDKNVVLYFTDNRNEPKKLDVFRAMTYATYIEQYDDYDELDFITACPKTPLDPITFEFDIDANRSISHFVDIPGMIFAYQHLYIGGVESAISTHSKLAVPRGLVSQGVNTGVTVQENVCILTIPEVSPQNENIVNRTKEILKIRILVRFGNTGVFKTIDEIDPVQLGGLLPGYRFYNDRLLVSVARRTINKNYDNLPRVAQAQTVINDRLVYGNYIEGYDEVDVDATISAIYKPENANFLDLDIKVTEFISEHTNSPVVSIMGNQRVAGFRISLAEIPDSIPEGSLFNLNFTCRPERGFHIYNQSRSFHGSSFKGDVRNAEEYASFGQSYYQNVDGGTSYDYYRNGLSFFGKNEGVKFIDPDDPNGALLFNKWRFDNPTAPSGIEEQEVVYGTSAANPFIIQSGLMQFGLTFSTNYGVTQGGKDLIKEVIAAVFTGSPLPEPAGVPFAQLLGDPIAETEYSFDLGLDQNGSKIMVSNINGAQDGLSRKDFVVAVGHKDFILDNGPENVPPTGYFIINKATVRIGLDVFPDLNQKYPDDPDAMYVGLDIKEINDAEIKTCIPHIRKDYMQFSPNEDDSSTTLDENMEGGWQWLNEQSLADGFTWMTESGAKKMQAVGIWNNLYIDYWKTYSRDYVASHDVETILGTPGSSNNNIFFWRDSEIQDEYGSIQADTGINLTVGTMLGLLQQQQNIQQQFLPDFSFASQQATETWRFRVGGYLIGPGGNANTPVQLINYPEEIEDKFEDYMQSYIEGNYPNYPDQYNMWEVSEFWSSNMQINPLCRFSLIDGITAGMGGRRGGVVQYQDGGYIQMIGDVPAQGSVSGQIAWSGQIRQRFQIQLLHPPGQFWAYGTGFNIQHLSAWHLEFFSNTSFTSHIARFSIEASSNFEGGDSTWDNPTYDWNEGDMKYITGFPHGGPGQYYSADWYEQIEENYADFAVTALGFGLGAMDYQSNAWVEINTLSQFVELGAEYGHFGSFKSKANHEFAVVYYDERGRAGFANYLGNLYVAGYSSQDINRNGFQGRVEVEIRINNDPPEWAHKYQIVYSGNTTYDNFIQYTTGGATAERPQTGEYITSDQGVIHVNLGYLQGSNMISYSSAYGAVNKEGGKDLYTYKEGDQLRILSYSQGGSEERFYPHEYVFDILGVQITSNIPSENPYHPPTQGGTETTVDSGLIGQFLMLRNNPSAGGFSYDAVINNDHLWNNGTIVEIFSRKKGKDEDDRIYYEIGEVFNVIRDDNGNRYHETNPILLRDGDIFYRKVALNYPPFEDGQYVNIISNNRKAPNFINYWLESETFTDKLPGSDSKNFGKATFVVPGATARRKLASLIYSDKNNYTARFNKFTNFNGPELNFKNLPNEYGAINYILNDYDNILVIQENKASSVPVSRNILSTAGGKESLIASDKILGTQKYYPGDYGSDGNPESVTRAGENVYFAHKGKRQVYKWSRDKGVQIISDIGMKSYFNNIFQRAIEDQAMGEGLVRVVGGYDPLRDEFILSVHNIQDLREYEVDYDPFEEVIDDDPGGGDDTDECDELCAEFLVESNAPTALGTMEFQPGDQFSINYTITNIGEGIGGFANDNFASYPFNQEGQPTAYMFGDWIDFVVQDSSAFVVYPIPTYDPDNGSISIMDQDPNINLTTIDLGYTIAIEPPLNEQLASYYPQSIPAAPGGWPLLFPGNTMSLTVTYQVPMDYTTGDYNFFTSFNFASYDIDSFNQGFNLNPDYGIGGATRYFDIPCCYTQSKTIIHRFTVAKPPTGGGGPTLPSDDYSGIITNNDNKRLGSSDEKSINIYDTNGDGVVNPLDIIASDQTERENREEQIRKK